MAIQQLAVRTDAEELVELRRQIDELEHRFAEVLGRFARSRQWELDGAVSPTAWLRWKCGLGSQAASVRVAVANTIDELPEVGEALVDGRMSFSQVQSVAAVTEVVGAEAMRPGVGTVIDVAQRLTADRFRFAMRHLRRLLDADGFARDAEREHDRRWLALSESYDGVYFVEGRLDAEGGAILKAALDPLMKPVRDDDRTARQRRADALVELASGGKRAHINITTSEAEMSGAVVLPFDTLRRLACDAEVTTIDPERMTVGTRRTIPPSVRRALELRDRGCSAPGCDRPTAWCDGHHIVHWADGGPTELDNLRLLCGYHHRVEHPRRARAGPGS